MHETVRLSFEIDAYISVHTVFSFSVGVSMLTLAY